jgi:trk system potassium uptake protein TrkA
MYIVILGAGRVGTQLARQLVLEKKDVALIERDSEKARDAANRLDCLIINDEGNSLEGLTKAGIQKADIFVSVTDSDETNLIACGLVSAEYDKVKTIARVRNLDYSRTKMISNSFLGIDYVINPEIEAARIISYAISHGARSDIMLFENTSLQMRNLNIRKESAFVGQSLKSVRQNMDFAFLIAAILRDDHYIIPSGETIIQEGDQLYIISSEKGFELIFKLEDLKKSELNQITLIGGGHISAYVVEELLNQDHTNFSRVGKSKIGRLFNRKHKRSLQIIEKDYDRCKELAERFPQVLVTHADVTDDSFNEEEFLAGTDLIITATNNQELNIITGIYAKTLGVDKAMALVIRNSYRNMAHNLNVDVTVCLNDTVVNSILKVIRKGNIKNVHALSGGKLEVVEFQIEENSPIAGKKISELKLPEKSLVIFLSHEGQDIIPTGDTIIGRNDYVVLILERESVSRIEKIISG